jgi:hypothetical protein
MKCGCRKVTYRKMPSGLRMRWTYRATSHKKEVRIWAGNKWTIKDQKEKCRVAKTERQRTKERTTPLPLAYTGSYRSEPGPEATTDYRGSWRRGCLCRKPHRPSPTRPSLPTPGRPPSAIRSPSLRRVARASARAPCWKSPGIVGWCSRGRRGRRGWSVSRNWVCQLGGRSVCMRSRATHTLSPVPRWTILG